MGTVRTTLDRVAWDGKPEMLIFDKFLRECAVYPHMHPGSKLTLNLHRLGDHQGCLGREGGMCFWGSIYNDGEYIYRIGEYSNEYGCDSWAARWPD